MPDGRPYKEGVPHLKWALMSKPSLSSAALADTLAVVSELKRDPELGGINPIAALVSLLNHKAS